MACAIVSPFNPILPCNSLKLRDLPIQWIASHRNQKLRGSVHLSHDTAGNITAQALGNANFWGLTFELTGTLRWAGFGQE